ncbi:MAG TPA: hypothetical protein VD735_05260 [Candidatus Saccharimonadales bacterium]|nr:hypothetical protein [Candidatus Saccharimonadales bacterium]
MKYFLGFLASIALIVLVVFLVIRGFSGGGDPAAKQRTPLTNYANTQTEVSMLVDGPINANQEHNAYRITVGRDQTTLETFVGYEQTVIENRLYENNEDSYRSFLAALDLAGFTRGDAEAAKKDPTGVCATDKRITLEITNGTSEIQKFWTTTCDIQGTFQGSLPQVAQLFRAQAPEFEQITRGLQL